eukprot:CAMPEP_0178600268 /NCGR_PEP_ID=MMETSP0697-20121206/33764_1 /TAXON_ID=265572 /ORGANISM="Extubocellulus spinifer, Strain CCMP396" /LENGTH=484 /DNA_ID=CAMNT_0020238249 /DNA_START=167 /DNA_END=1618 /DNA_ORIENTATION=-
MADESAAAVLASAEPSSSSPADHSQPNSSSSMPTLPAHSTTSGRAPSGNSDGTEITVRTASMNVTWDNMKLRRRGSFDADQDDALAAAAAAETAAAEAPGAAAVSSLLSKSRGTTRKRLSSTRSQPQGPEEKNTVLTYVLDDQTTVLEAILSPDRLNALLACDEQVLSYDPRRWTIVFRPHGRNIQMIALPLVVITIWGVLWCGILSMDGMESVRDAVADLEGLITPLLVPVSFLLVFRLGRAAVRFWDARSSTGKIVEMCRVIISTAAVGCATIEDGTELLNDFARYLCAYPIAVKNFLRPSARKGWGKDAKDMKRRFELGQLLSDSEAEAVLNTSDVNLGTIVILNKLRQLAWMAATAKDTQGGSDASLDLGPRDMLYRQLNEQIDTLTGAFGACERISSTPLPLVYVAHLRTFLLLYLILWSMESAANHGWVSIPIVFAASWGLLGIEAAAVECERPFQWQSNHLPLGKVGVVVSRNVAQT